MASNRDDLIEADRAQRELGQQVRRCQMIIQNGRQLFMLAQASVKRDGSRTRRH